jgi:hypothetical protein
MIFRYVLPNAIEPGEYINNLNTTIMTNLIKAVNKVTPIKKSSRLDGFTTKFYLIFKELVTMFLKLLHE